MYEKLQPTNKCVMFKLTDALELNYINQNKSSAASKGSGSERPEHLNGQAIMTSVCYVSNQ